MLNRPRYSLPDIRAAIYAAVPSHIWLGVSVESASHTNRIDHLQGIDSSAGFTSFKPLLGDVGQIALAKIAWAIVGSEGNPRV